MNCNDLRFVKTEENLKKTLLHMLETRPLEKISIKDLCEKARCSRNAFYQHYSTKDELYNAILSDMMTAIEESTYPIEKDQTVMDSRKISAFNYKLLNCIADHRDDFTSLMNGNDGFLIFMRDSLYRSFLSHYAFVAEGKTLTRKGELLTRYFCAGIAGFIENWLKDSSLSIEEAQQYLDICAHDNFTVMRDILIADS